MSSSSNSSMSDFDMDMDDVNEGVEIKVQSSMQQSVKKLQEIVDEDPPEFGIDEDNMEDWESDSQAPSLYRKAQSIKSEKSISSRAQRIEKLKCKYYYLFDGPQKKKRGKVDVEGRFYKHQEKVNEKIKNMTKIMEEKQVEECTFKPTILNKSKTRSVPDFLKHMNKYDEHIKTKLKTKINEKEEEITRAAKNAKPKLCKKSLAIAEKKAEMGIERLAKPKAQTPLPEDKNPYKPKVNIRSHDMLREKPVDKILYEDALRRYSKTTVGETNANEKYTSERSEKVLLDRFKREFAEMFGYLDLENTLTLSYTKFTTLLYNMNFMSRASSKISKQRQLAVEIWSLLGGDQNENVTYANLQTFFICLMNYRDPSIRSHQGPNNMGILCEGIFCVNPPEILKIHRYFSTLFEERSHPKKQSLNNSFENTSFSEVRKKTDTKYEDMLILEKARLQEKWENIRQKRLSEEVSECTFQPRIKRGPRTIASSSDLNDSNVSQYSFYSETKSQSQRRNDILYDYSKVFNQQRHNSTKHHFDLDSSNEVRGCTFKPKLAKRVKVEEVPEAKGVKELINRLRNARKTKEPKKQENEEKPFVFGLERSTSRLSIDLNSSISSNESSKNWAETSRSDMNKSFSSDTSRVSIKINLPGGKKTVFQVKQGENKLAAINDFVKSSLVKGEAKTKLRTELKKLLIS
ncbi:hypothetical protein SteCoe_10128 [Stentor coeruleus]|uniref:EF-hand domain-containing protein n=1 Tax=Stentor coeruleus TaxID=5963 RepID=A0A1R2CGC5_9CILI|nr:hypothetical protein SteCoe_10128 [Stentor coeruleus]